MLWIICVIYTHYTILLLFYPYQIPILSGLFVLFVVKPLCLATTLYTNLLNSCRSHNGTSYNNFNLISAIFCRRFSFKKLYLLQKNCHYNDVNSYNYLLRTILISRECIKQTTNTASLRSAFVPETTLRRLKPIINLKEGE